MTTATLNSSFVFYQSFYEMIALIPDTETQLAAYGMICAYALEGTEPKTDNWVLRMIFSAAKPQLDSNRERRENGKKGGRKPVEAAEAITEAIPTKEQKTDILRNLVEERNNIQKNAEDIKDTPKILVKGIKKQEGTVLKEECVPINLVQEDHPQEDCCQKKQEAEPQTMAPQTEQPQSAQWAEQPERIAQPTSQQEEPHIAQDDILLYGENKYPVTQMELKKIQNFAQKLFQKYDFGHILNEFDIDKIMKYTIARKEINGVAVGILDRDKADLLEYAVKQAEAAQKLNWRYIEGMYRNFLLRDIKTGAEAYQYDLSRNTPIL